MPGEAYNRTTDSKNKQLFIDFSTLNMLICWIEELVIPVDSIENVVVGKKVSPIF